MKKLYLTFLIFVFAAAVFAAADSLFSQAGVMLTKGEFQKAVELYEKFVKDNPQDRLSPAAIFNAASIRQLELCDNKSALKDFRRLIKQYPHSPYTAEAHRRCGEIHLEMGNLESAFQSFTEAIAAAVDNENTSDFWLNQIAEQGRSCLEKIDNASFKLEGYKQLLQILPYGDGLAQSFYRYAGLLKDQGRESEAAKEYYYLTSQFPTSNWAQTAAKENAELLTKTFLDYSAEIMQDFGRWDALRRQNNFTEIGIIMERILANTSNEGWRSNAELALIINTVYLTGDFETGLDKLQDFLVKRPERKKDAQCRLYEETLNEILKLLDQIASHPDDYGVHEQLGFILLRHRFYSLAEEHFLQAAAHPEATNSFLGLGYVYLRTNQPDKAVEKLEIYLRDNPEDGNTFNQVGYAYLQIGRNEDALKCFKRYRDLEPDNPNAHDSYAECLMNMGQTDEAIAEYNEALKLDKNWSNGIFMLGEIYRLKGDTGKALEYYEQYISMDPNGLLSEQARAAAEEIKGIGKREK